MGVESTSAVSMVSVPPAAHRVAGIDRQIEDHLLDLAGVGDDPAKSHGEARGSEMFSPIVRRSSFSMRPTTA